MNIDVILGKWGDGSSASDRYAVSFQRGPFENGPGVTVIDAGTRDIAKNELVGRALRQEDIVGEPVSERVFAVCNAILAQDERLDALRSGGR